MSLFYTGKRPVTKGKNANDSVHLWKGTAGVYSNWDLMNPSHVLDGAPDSDYTPGSGQFPGDYMMSRIFRGLSHNRPITDVGGGERLLYGRYRPLEYHGSNGVFDGTWGHEAGRDTIYSSDHYTQSIRINHLTDPGHAIRDDESGAASTFGHFGPNVNHGVSEVILTNDGGPVPTGHDNPYGKNHMKVWQGVTSAKALNV